MCGIIGIIGKQQVSTSLLDGLKRLEYRGYDSSGIATIDSGHILCSKAAGKISNLENTISQHPLKGKIGIAHTRWATHGAPTEANAHPHHNDNVALVHNGIIENYASLKEELISQGYKFSSETDTEVILALISHYLEQSHDPLRATEDALTRLEGAFAIAVIFASHPELMIGARKGAPLAIGFGNGEMYLGSDAFALLPLSNRISYLEDGDYVLLKNDSFTIYDKERKVANRDIKTTDLKLEQTGKGNFPHFMLKEIYEQPNIIAKILQNYCDATTKEIKFPIDNSFNQTLKDIENITIVACGTSYFAGMIAKYWLERFTKAEVTIDIASEFRYRNFAKTNASKRLAIFISQSGETADSLAALRELKKFDIPTLAIVNVNESSIAREASFFIPILAGPEIGVASTKAFSAQVTVMLLLALKIGELQQASSSSLTQEIIFHLSDLPAKASELIETSDELNDFAERLSQYHHILYMGRGTSYPIALEAALKLKELSYIHAEGIACGELKHGSIALIDPQFPSIVILSDDNLFEKTWSNCEEVKARGGQLFILTSESKFEKAKTISQNVYKLPDVHPILAPLLFALPAQLLAYKIALKLGKDIDQPRNLAKSVTVE